MLRQFRFCPTTALISFVFALLTASAAVARPCSSDVLSERSGDGSVLLTGSGAVYRVIGVGETNPALWHSASKILVCRKSYVYQGKPVTLHEIINTSDGAKVSAMRTNWHQCADDTLSEKLEDGLVLVMRSGAVYQVTGRSGTNSALWHSPSDMLVCRSSFVHTEKPLRMDEIINMSDGGRVSATRTN